MKSLGKHFIIEFHDCDPDALNNKEILESHILESVRVSGATVIQPFFHQFSPHGVSGIVVIAESHFSIHTWPEYGYCAVDIFTCGEDIDNEAALEYLRTALQSRHYSLMEMKRGTFDIPGLELRHKPEMELR